MAPIRAVLRAAGSQIDMLKKQAETDSKASVKLSSCTERWEVSGEILCESFGYGEMLGEIVGGK